MGSIAATTIIKTIRDDYLLESIDPAQLTSDNAGTTWKNGQILRAINFGKDHAWTIIIKAREDFFLVLGDTSVPLDAATKTYSLPARFWQLKGIKATTSGYEMVDFEPLDRASEEFKRRDRFPQSGSAGNLILGYDIVGNRSLSLCDFPPATLATSIDYIETLADYTLSDSSTSNIPDHWIKYVEAWAAEYLLQSVPKDARYVAAKAKVLEYAPLMLDNMQPRQIRDPEYVETWSPY